MRRTCSLLLLLILFTITVCAQKVSDPGWKQLTASDDIYFYHYSSKQLTKTPEGTIKFWVKMSPTVQGILDNTARNEVFHLRQQYHLSTKGYDEWRYRLTEYEFNCSQGKFKILSQTDYKKSGRELDSTTFADQWLDVAPDSLAEEMFDRICRGK